MQSKTPQFDQALDEIFKDLVPHVRECKDCKKDFEITAEDITFLHKLRVPPPTLCPTCRRRRRLSFANYSSIYRRKCQVPGHTEEMISLVAPVMPWITYDHETYYSDKWDRFSYGREFDLKTPFLEQYHTLLSEIPQPGVRRGPNSTNSDFSFYGRGMKDCYYVFGSWTSENVLYSASIYVCRNIVDSYYLRNMDTAYENILTEDSFKCTYSYFTMNSIDCDFMYDCRNCQNCFGCMNLRNKQYCWFNEQLTKEEYQKRKASVDLGSRAVVKEYKKKFWDFVKANPIRAVRSYLSNNVTGNDIKESHDCHEIYQVEKSESVRYGQMFTDVRDTMDASFSGHAEGLYETQNVGHGAHVKFSFACKETTHSEYLMSCDHCSNCFGCVGLRDTSYAIFNKRYEPEEYWKRVDAIKTEMLKRGEYGEFFPMSFAPYAYNSSLAHIMYPMSEIEAKERGLFWQNEIEVDTKSIKPVSISELPDNIKDVPENICTLAVVGENGGKPFRFVPQEIDFYKRYNIALPTKTPYERIMDRFAIMNNLRIEKDACYKCGNEIMSSYKTSDGYKPYCAQCYKGEFE